MGTAIRREGEKRQGGGGEICEGGWIYWDSDRQTAHRLSKAALILHSPATSRSPPASPLSPATCLPEDNTTQARRRDNILAAFACGTFSASSNPSPPLCTPVLRGGPAACAQGALGDPGLLSLPAEERSATRQAIAGAAVVEPGCHLRRSHLHGCAMATFVCRVQFLDDTDPFNSTNFPEPTRAPLYTFREDIPLINQLAGVHRLLKAPHKVGSPLVNNSSCT